MLYFVEIVLFYFWTGFSVSIRKNFLGKHINEYNFFKTLFKSTLEYIFLCVKSFSFSFFWKQIELFRDKFLFAVISE